MKIKLNESTNYFSNNQLMKKFGDIVVDYEIEIVDEDGVSDVVEIGQSELRNINLSVTRLLKYKNVREKDLDKYFSDNDFRIHCFAEEVNGDAMFTYSQMLSDIYYNYCSQFDWEVIFK